MITLSLSAAAQQYHKRKLHHEILFIIFHLWGFHQGSDKLIAQDVHTQRKKKRRRHRLLLSPLA
jgi:hypothetical protein